MSVKSPLGVNYGWLVTQDHYFTPRDISGEARVALAISAVLADPELRKIESVLKHRVVLAVDVGQFTLHVRIYDHHAVGKKADRLVSRSGAYDSATYLVFTPQGGLEAASGDLLDNAKTHVPLYYAVRRLSPSRQQTLDALQVQLTQQGSLPLPLSRIA